MSNLLHPVGPERPAVYWRRRVVLLLAVVGLVALVVLLPGRGGQADAPRQDPVAAPNPQPTAEPTAAPTPDPTADPATDPTTEPTGDGGPACEQEQLDVAVATDAASYGPGAAPRFTLSAANAGQEPCVVDMGSTDAVELVVTSGDDRVWSSDDCQETAGEARVTLEPGQQEEQSVSWQRIRSAPDCPGDLTQPGSGTYQVTARVGTTTSEPATFTLD